MKIAIAQMNCIVGDIAGNAKKIVTSATLAKEQGATLVVTPELSLCGYSPEDLLLRPDFLLACEDALLVLAKQLPDITVIVGHPHQQGEQCFNAASVLEGGHVVATYHKQVLPNYGVFDEERYFVSGSEALVFNHCGVKLGVLICADVWESKPALLAKMAGAELLVAMNGSPFHMKKQNTRLEVLKQRAVENSLPIVYVNMVGGQDELVFDGASFVLNAQGELMCELPAFESQLEVVDFEHAQPLHGNMTKNLPLEATVYHALKLGLADYVNKNGFPGVVIGLSGGVDSALTLAIAVDAIGADKVHAVMMPSEFTADISVNDAREMADIVGVEYSEIAIKPLYDMYLTALSPQFGDMPFDATEENLQARIRGMLLMAISNKFGSIVVTTGNKSEMAVGYCTLYGDMAGGFALLKDVPKTLVYQLCAYRNQLSSVIPERIITRPPSAELRANQVDQDSLPPYDVLDAIIEAYVEDDLSRKDIVALGYPIEDVNRVIAMIDRNEYKRRQSPVGVRITDKGFGKDRRYPITAKLSEYWKTRLN
ncbi:NAD+ synthase [Methylotenera mobilis]|uniref:NAD+ synthase n=1 Tax=Methylotenera mobilis TaxID=359408 RepID=UPI000368D2A2|nr:NAD+ synthase [Methylotenera mobilis]PPC96387.1 MAG: NAD+ synthase [Methylotenera sp.]